MSDPPIGERSARRSTFTRLDADLAEAVDRSADRQRRIVLAGAFGLASKVLVAAALILAVPLVAHHLSAAELGVWTILVSAVALVGFADFGLGNGLLNLLTRAIGRRDHEAARRAVTAGMVSLGGVALAGGAIAAILVPTIAWGALFGVSPGEVPGLEAAVACFAATILLAIPASIGQRIHMAYQQTWAASLTTGIGSLLSLLAVWVAADAGAGLPVLVAAMLGGTTVAYGIETAWVLGRSHRDLRPSRTHLDRTVVRRLFRTGSAFFGLVLANAIGYQTDAIVVANHLGSAAAATVVLASRLFTFAPMVLGTVLLPLWPAYGEAIARGDLPWVRRTIRRSLLSSLAISGTAACLLVVLAPPLLRVWAPTVAAPSTSLVLALATWSVVAAISLAVAMYLNGAHLIRFQLVVSSIMAVTNIVASVLLVRRVGIAGPVWASVATQCLIVLVPAFLVLRRAAREDGGEPTTRSRLVGGDLPGATP
jgi:O-antigen/teichoic acid export membrane protein